MRFWRNLINKNKILKYIALALSFPVIGYLVLALVLQSITVGEYKEKADDKFPIYITVGDIHTEIVFPTSNGLFDWTRLVPVKLVTDKIVNPKFITIGWGSRDFFFNMKTWDEIKWSIILRAIFLPGESTLHVEYLANLDSAPKAYPLYLSKAEYLNLVSFVTEYFVLDHLGKVETIGDYTYYGTDKFFKSHHSYHMLNTCNMWTLSGLKIINARRPLWSPFKYGIESSLRN